MKSSLKPAGAHGGPGEEKGGLPSFAKTLGLDLIVTPSGEVVLIELQHHFGRSGLTRLYPSVSRHHRRLGRRLRMRYGRCPYVYESLRAVCSDKIKTYRRLGRFQPPSFVYQGWARAVQNWIEGLSCDFIIAKPPRGSCGRGISVFPRLDAGRWIATLPKTGPILLQGFVESKKLVDGSGLSYLGCIRHILHLFSDTRSIGIVHLPPYWRFSPEPFSGSPRQEAFTANISSGASARIVDDGDCALVREATETIVIALLEDILGAGEVRLGTSSCLFPEDEPDTIPRRGRLTSLVTSGK